jgi:hypothetical protein
MDKCKLYAWAVMIGGAALALVGLAGMIYILTGHPVVVL